MCRYLDNSTELLCDSSVNGLETLKQNVLFLEVALRSLHLSAESSSVMVELGSQFLSSQRASGQLQVAVGGSWKDIIFKDFHGWANGLDSVEFHRDLSLLSEQLRSPMIEKLKHSRIQFLVASAWSDLSALSLALESPVSPSSLIVDASGSVQIDGEDLAQWSSRDWDGTTFGLAVQLVELLHLVGLGLEEVVECDFDHFAVGVFVVGRVELSGVDWEFGFPIGSFRRNNFEALESASSVSSTISAEGDLWKSVVAQCDISLAGVLNFDLDRFVLGRLNRGAVIVEGAIILVAIGVGVGVAVDCPDNREQKKTE